MKQVCGRTLRLRENRCLPRLFQCYQTPFTDRRAIRRAKPSLRGTPSEFGGVLRKAEARGSQRGQHWPCCSSRLERAFKKASEKTLSATRPSPSVRNCLAATSYLLESQPKAA